MLLRLGLTATLLLSSACFLNGYTAKFPLRGPMIEIVNPTSRSFAAWASDGQRLKELAPIPPLSRTCRPWPFVADAGWIVVAAPGRKPSELTRSKRFQPWDQRNGHPVHAWSWTVGSDSVRFAPGTCQTRRPPA